MCVISLSACTQDQHGDTFALEVHSQNGTVKEYDIPSTLNPFYGLKVSFSGEPNRGHATIDAGECLDFVKDNFTFECENDGKLSNGGKAVIKAIYDADAFGDVNLRLSCTEKEYTVTGVEFYPSLLEGYGKDKINKAIRRAADRYIDDNIKDIEMEFESRQNHNDWGKSGAFNYTYNYCDIIMIYNVNNNDPSQNTYFVIYELSNEIECTESMSDSDKDLMTAGQQDTGWAYVVVGASGITATSDMEFNDDVEYEIVKGNIKTFTSLENAKEYCTYGGEYKTVSENFV